MKKLLLLLFLSSFILIQSCKKESLEIDPKRSQNIPLKFIVNSTKNGIDQSVNADFTIFLNNKMYKRGEFKKGKNILVIYKFFSKMSLSVCKVGHKDFNVEFDYNELLPYRNKDFEIVLEQENTLLNGDS